MSAFDDNPFAEPTLDNPFADPSVTRVTDNADIAQRGLEDYSPFSNQKGPNRQPQSAIMQETPPPVYTKSAQQQQQQPSTSPAQNISTADFQRRQEELERKAEQLSRMEEQLRQASSAAASGRRNNWPPLPASCPVQPCFYQDINVEIPLDFQKIVRHTYYLWLFHTLVMLLNMVGSFALLLLKSEISMFGLSILYFMLFTPLSFMCWFRPLYKAFRSDSSVNFMVYFFVFFFQFMVTVIQAIGLPGSGTCGILMAIKTFDKSAGSIFVGILVLIVALGFVTAATADILLISKVHHIYRTTGASFTKAQQEFSSDIMGNRHVRSAAANITAAAVNSQMNSSSRY